MLFTEDQINKSKTIRENYFKERQKKINQEIRETIWYKLYLLQNYTLTKDMFIGSTMRWKSITTYASFIRALYQGRLDQYKSKSKYTKSLLTYIRGLIDSGVEPYPAPEEINNKKMVSVDYLIKNKILNSHQIKEIYEPVSKENNFPDTSIAFSRDNKRNDREVYNTGSYYRIVPEEIFKKDQLKSEFTTNYVSDPIKNKTNPLKFIINKDFNIMEAFKSFI